MSLSSSFLQDFHVRPTAMDDLEPALELVNACCRADYDQHWSVTEETLRNTWQSPAIHLETDSWVVIGPGEHLIGETLELANGNETECFSHFLHITA